ncbi:MAG: tetratricopeptide repeat protein [Bacteroidales bacterium]
MIIIALLAIFSGPPKSHSQSITQDSCSSLIALGVDLLGKKNFSKSLEILTRCRNIAEENGWPQQQFLAINNIGLNYYLMSDFGEALKNYLAAYEIALKNKDEKLETTALNNIAVLYMKNREFAKAHEYFMLACTIAEKNGDQVRLGMYSTNLALVSNQQRILDEGRKYALRAVDLLRDEPGKQRQARAALAENLFLWGEVKKSKAMLQELIMEFQSGEDKQFLVFTLMVLSKIFEQEKYLEEAIRYVAEAQALETDPERKTDIFDRLSTLYFQKGSYVKAMTFKDSVIATKERIYQIKNGQLFETNKIKIEMENYRRQLSESRAKLALERKLLFGIIFSSLVFIAALVWIFRSDSVKNRQKKKIAELELEKERQKSLLREKQVREQETLAQLQQEQLKNELDKKNRELTAKALQASSRIEAIGELVNSLSQLPEVARNEFLTSHIYNLKRQLKNNNYWDSFQKHFEEANRGFIDSLLRKHDDLTQTDIRFITFVYMNLTNEEISLLLNITPQSCRKRRERIARKLGLTGYSKLPAYLSGI